MSHHIGLVAAPTKHHTGLTRCNFPEDSAPPCPRRPRYKAIYHQCGCGGQATTAECWSEELLCERHAFMEHIFSPDGAVEIRRLHRAPLAEGNTGTAA